MLSEDQTVVPVKKYFAFVSYNSADRQEAEKLQRQIERYRLPAIIREEVTKKTAVPCPHKLSPVFRDVTDLPVGPLSELLRKELEQSRYLIVICSPNAAQSNWVNREAEHFIKLGWYDRIIPYMIADDRTLGFNACCPPILRDPPEFQDDNSLDLTKAEDCRKNEESKNALQRMFEAPEMKDKVPLKGVSLIHEPPAYLKVVARMLEIAPDALIQRDAEHRRRVLIRWIYAVASVAIVFMFLTAWAVHAERRATEQRLRAEDNLQKARSAVNTFFTNVVKNPDIKDAGLMQFRRELLDLARQYREDFAAQWSGDPDVIAEQVNALFDTAGIVTLFGYPLEAIDYYRQAVELGDELVTKHPNNNRYLDILAKCYKDLAVAYNQAQFPPEQVLESNLKALAINRRLVDEFGDVAEYHRNLARILQNLGTWTLRRGNANAAEGYFRDSLAVRDGMTRFDDPPEYYFGKAQTHFALAVLRVDGERFLEADHEFATASHFLDDLRERYPERFRNDEISLLGTILFGRGEMKLNEAQPEIARSYLVRAIDESFAILTERAPEHIGYQRQLNNAISLVFECLVREGRDDMALALYQHRVESLLETAAAFPEVVQFLCQWYLTISEFYLERERKDEAIQTLQDGFEMLNMLDDHRSLEEEELLERIRTRLREILDEPT